MEHKVKLGITSAGIVAIVFGILGCIYSFIGIMLTQMPANAEDHTVGIVFLALGGSFVVLTLVLLVCTAFHRKHMQKIVDAGNYVWGEITEIITNYNVRVNNRCPFVLLVRYQDHSGKIHIFRSRNLKNYPDRSVIGKQVKVYYENESYKHYYIDLEGVLPKVIEH